MSLQMALSTWLIFRKTFRNSQRRWTDWKTGKAFGYENISFLTTSDFFDSQWSYQFPKLSFLIRLVSYLASCAEDSKKEPQLNADGQTNDPRLQILKGWSICKNAIFPTLTAEPEKWHFVLLSILEFPILNLSRLELPVRERCSCRSIKIPALRRNWVPVLVKKRWESVSITAG